MRPTRLQAVKALMIAPPSDGLAHPPQRPGGLDPPGAFHPPQRGDDVFGDRGRLAEEKPFAAFLESPDSLADVLGLLLAHALKGRQRAVADDAPQVVQSLDPELLEGQPDGLGAQAGNMEQGEEARRQSAHSFLGLGHASGREVFDDFAGQPVADPLDVTEPLLRGHCRDILGQLVQDAGRFPISQDLEGRLALDVQRVRDALEDGRNLPVFHRRTLSLSP
jgi:hypothetical protein